MPLYNTLKIFGAAGAGGSVVGLVTHDEVLNWTGTAIAVGSALVTAGLAGYHKYRDARRAEDARDREAARKDRTADRDEVRAMGRVIAEVEMRIAKAETDASELARRLEAVHCRYPLANGAARCSESNTCRKDILEAKT
jgi:hypothetical protein